MAEYIIILILVVSLSALWLWLKYKILYPCSKDLAGRMVDKAGKMSAAKQKFFVFGMLIILFAILILGLVLRWHVHD